MKLLNIFSAVICILYLGVGAVPATLTPSALEARADTRTAEYEKAHGTHSSIVTGKTYAFTIKFPKGKEADKKMKELTDELGYGHIGLVVGTVVETPQGPPKKPTGVKKDFVATMYHMVGVQKVESEVKNWRSSSAIMEFVKETKKTQNQIKAAGKTPVKNLDNRGNMLRIIANNFSRTGKAWTDAHPKYDYETNHCGKYVDNLISKL